MTKKIKILLAIATVLIVACLLGVHFYTKSKGHWQKIGDAGRYARGYDAGYIDGAKTSNEVAREKEVRVYMGQAEDF